MKESKQILILGCGKTGESILSHLLQQNKNITLYDDNIENAINLANKFKNINILEKIEDLKKLDIEFAAISPSIRTIFNPHKIVLKLQEMNIKIISDFDLMYQNINKNIKLIGLTGTNGKSTTTALLDFVLKELGKNSISCGNIGTPVLDCNFENIEYVCIEASSYQLEISSVSFYAGILLNITQDHLEHHGEMSEYIKQKINIFKHNKVSIISNEDEHCKKILNENGNYNQISCSEILKVGFSFYENNFYKNNEKLNFNIQDLQILGKHNMQNILAVLSFCFFENFDLQSTFDAICKFKPLPHRMEIVRKIGNITFVNDSKATNPNSVKCALSCFNEVYLIAGGVSKYPKSILEISQYYSKIKHFLLIGKAAAEFNNDLPIKNKRTMYANMKNAVIDAYNKAKLDIKKDQSLNPVILLSPLCASFDMYENFEKRGDDFKNIVKNYIN